MVKLSVVKAKAKLVGVNNPSADKTDLIRQIQCAEGFTACFKTKDKCEEANCSWREDCLK